MAGSEKNQGLIPNELAQRFRVERPLTRGGSGNLFLAVEENTGIRGVLKLLRSRLFRGTPDKQRFRREIARQATIDHPHLVSPSVSGEIENSVWLFRDYAEGITVRERLEQSGTIPLPETLAIIAQVASALHELHDAGLVHRDLKPEHIILQDDGSGIPRAVVIDASVAAPIEFESVFDVSGTPSYVSPEQVQGRLISFRSDLYALGCVFYEMLTGYKAFGAATIDETMTAHVQQPPPSAPEGMPEAAAVLLRQLFDKKPRQRPESALAVFRALVPLLSDAGRASVLTDPALRSPSKRPSKPPPPPPSGEFEAMSDLATASTLVTNPPAAGEVPPDAAVVSETAPDTPEETVTEETVTEETPPPEAEAPIDEAFDEPPAPEAEEEPTPEPEPELDVESERPANIESNDPGPTTAAEAMNLDFDQLAQSIGESGLHDKGHDGEELLVLAPKGGGGAAAPGSGRSLSEPVSDFPPPISGEQAADMPIESSPAPAPEPSDGAGPVPSASSAGTDYTGPPPADEEPGSSPAEATENPEEGNVGLGSPNRTTWVLLVAVVLAFMVLWTLLSVEFFGESGEEISDASPDAVIVYLFPEGGWYWRPDAALEYDGSVFAEGEIDILNQLYPLDIDAGLAAEPPDADVGEPRRDASADGGDAGDAGDRAAERAMDGAMEGGLDGGPDAADTSPPDAGPPDAEPPPPPTWDELREQARDLFTRGDYEGARDTYLQLVRQRRDHAGSWAGLGASYARLEEWERTVSAYQQAIIVNPRKSGFYASLGNAFRELRDLARARQAYERALELNPRNVVAMRALRELGVVFDRAP